MKNGRFSFSKLIHFIVFLCTLYTKLSNEIAKNISDHAFFSCKKA